MEGDDAYSAGATEIYGSLEQLFGVAVATAFGSGVEVQEIGAFGLDVHPVRGEVLKMDAGTGEDFAVFFDKKADVAAVREALANPGFEGGVHGGEVCVGGEVVVGKHLVAVFGYEVCVGRSGLADGGHEQSVEDRA